MNPREFAVRVIKEVPSSTTVSILESSPTDYRVVAWFGDGLKMSIKGENKIPKRKKDEKYKHSFIISEGDGPVVLADFATPDDVIQIMKEL